MKKHNSEYYLKLCRRALLEIMAIGPEQGERFLLLKKKAKRYLEKAKELDASTKK